MLRRDLIAGLSVAGLMLPEAVAYAGIAGLPPQRAIFAAIAGCLIYAAVGRSRFAIVSPTSSSAAILAAALAVLPGDAAQKALLATLAVGLAGLVFLVAALARLGGLTGFISRPVLRGFAFGLAVVIIMRQLPAVVGVDLPAHDLFALGWGLATSLPSWHAPSVIVGIAALLALLALRRVPALPGAFIVLVAGVAASALFGLAARGVAVVGSIDMALSWPVLQPLPWASLLQLVELVLPLVLILFAESWGTMRALALRHGDTIEPNRELGALGLANLGAALVQGMPVGAGFSAGSASEAAGASSRATAAIAAIGLALLILAAAPLVALLPQPVLAAVVIAALTHALDPAPLLRLWRLRRDQYVALGAAAGVMLLGVLNGMLFAIVLSLLALLSRLATPNIVRLGRLAGSHDFVDLARHPEAVSPPGMAIWRPMVPLFFANAETVLGIIGRRQTAEPAARVVILSLEESFDLDSTAAEALIEFDARMRAQGLTLLLARVRDGVRDLLIAAGAAELAQRATHSVDDAVVAAGAGASKEKTDAA